jgi:predicted TIM-barrel fold metal-dependent hydrolase
MLGTEHGFRALDCNVRLAPAPDAAGAPPWAVGVDALERDLHAAGVVRAAVAPAGTSPGEGYLRANNAVARLAVDRPLVALARLDGPRDPRETPAARLRNLRARREAGQPAPEDVEGYAHDDRFHGVALDPARDGLPDAETLDALAATDLPAVVRAGRGFPPAAAATALLDRGLTVVLLRFGGHPLERGLMTAGLDLLEGYDRCHLETGRVGDRDLLERGLLEHPDRILFGSDAPRRHPNVGLMELLSLDVPADALERAFAANPARVIPGLDGG